MVSRQWQRWLTALSLDRIARHWLGGRGLIVMLHRIAAEPGAWRGNPGLWITLQQLRGIIVTLRDEGYEWMSLSDALTRPASRHQPRFACLTFDDGYRDNYELALPLLRDWGIPATIYVTTGFVEGTVPDWRHGLESIIAQHPVLELRLQQQQERFSTAGPGEKDSVYRQVCDRLSAAKPVTRAQALCQLAQDYGVDFDHSSLDQMLTVPMLRQFAASGLIELGAHTVSHPLLTDLPHDAARTEMRVSKERLEALGGRPVTHFAYPFGKRDCATPALRTLARECGFSSAVLAYGGPVYPDSNRYALPRLPFGDEDSLAALRLRASGARSLFARHPHSEHSSGESNA